MFSFVNYPILNDPQYNPLASALQGYVKGKDVQSKIAEAQAHAGLYGKQSEEVQYKLQHPGYMGDETTKTLQFLKDSGLISQDEFNQQHPQSQAATGLVQNQSSTITPGNPVQQATIGLAQQSNQPITPGTPVQQATTGLSQLPFNFKNPTANAIANKPFVDMQYKQQQTQGYNWTHAPDAAKQYMLGQAAGIGVDPSQAIDQYGKGRSFQDLLKMKGLPLDADYSVRYLPTTSNIAEINKRNSSVKQMDVISDFVTEAAGNYAPYIGTLSPSQFKDALLGKNKQQQAEFAAASILAPDLAGLRYMALGGRIGIGALNHMEEAQMTRARPLLALMDPEIYKEAQKIASRKIHEAVNASNEVWYPTKAKSKEEEKSSQMNVKKPSEMSDEEIQAELGIK